MLGKKMTKIIQQRKRIFIAGEGEGEQSFVKWLQRLSDQNGLHVHLDCQPLGGGGYKTMLEKTVHECKRKGRSSAKSFILLVDSDRAERGDDGWSLLQLKQEASKHKINVCVQNPNQEGLLVRMMPGNESLQPNIAKVQKQLRSIWPDYQKPVDAQTLASKFTLGDLLRVARVDLELKLLLSIIGL